MSSNDEDNYRPNWLSKFYQSVGKALSALTRDAKALGFTAESRAAIGDWLKRNYVWLAILIGGGFYIYLWLYITGDLPGLATTALAKLGTALNLDGEAFDSDVVRNLAYAIGALLGGIALLATVPFQLIKTWMNERQAITTEQGHITDRFTKAIGQLGEEKTVTRDEETRTEPNLEVRLGAIYALERIAQDSERDHIPIMETLSAYIRQNTKGKPSRDLNLAAFPPLLNKEAKEEAHKLREAEIALRRENYHQWLTTFGPVVPPRDDVRAALRVLASRDEGRRAYERRNAFRIDLVRANLQRTDLRGARLDQANLTEARMEGAVLSGARMEGADLWGASLKSTDLRDWSIARTSLRSVDFTEAKNLTQEAVNSAFGDAGTILPDGIERPCHWDDEKWFFFTPEVDTAYQEWLAAGAPATGPCPE